MEQVKIEMIKNYDDFVKQLMTAGMSVGGENGEGIFTLCDYFEKEVQWHTGNEDTDPWEWRMRVLDERSDIAYGKIFFKKSGYITSDWYPYFYSIRRGGRTLDEDYEEGRMNLYSKRIYDVFKEYKTLPLHQIRELCGFKKEEKSKFDRGLTELQMKLYLTMCGRERKRSLKGEEYGWSATVFCKTEDYFPPEILKKGESVKREEGYEKIRRQILLLNPNAEEKKIKKYIEG